MCRVGWSLLVLGMLCCAQAAQAQADDPNAPPEPEAVPAQDTGQPPDPDAPAPPPPPATPGDFAGTASGGEAPDDELSRDTAEEPDVHVREREHREFSVRIDPLNWLLLGRFAVELEMGVWKFISVELIPLFVTATQPILLNYSRLDNTLTQHSRGIGPIPGVSLGVGFWIFGEPFSGYVIRLNFANYAYTYRAADGGGTFDTVEHTDRQLRLFFGSHSRFGPFTLAGGFGLGIELNPSERCGLASTGDGDDFQISGRTSNCEGKQLIALNRDLTETADLNGPLHPVYFEARFSIGLVF
ncbi:MAG TPA: hypothetical protein VJV78_47190 [Polyangiales bacterium]|nr:hypothetical protein [Polyangiales bacterium]